MTGMARPSEFTGKLATSNGDYLRILPVENIINAAETTVYIPRLNTTKTISSAVYDYINRVYALTTDEGETISVTYGDTEITIWEESTQKSELVYYTERWLYDHSVYE